MRLALVPAVLALTLAPLGCSVGEEDDSKGAATTTATEPVAGDSGSTSAFLAIPDL